MEKSQPNPSPSAPTLCVQNCGFFGNPMFGNMCSKCFKDEQQRQKQQEQVAAVVATPMPTADAASAPITPNTITASASPSIAIPPAAVAVSIPATSPTAQRDDEDATGATSSEAAEVTSTPAEPEKPVQKQKDRCFICKSKLTLAKQISNKCRCEYIYCDNHRVPAQHDCEFDHKLLQQSVLEKRNPKMNERKTGGRSFTRID